MQYRPFGSKGQQVSVIGMGTWSIDLADRDTAVRALQAGRGAAERRRLERPARGHHAPPPLGM